MAAGTGAKTGATQDAVAHSAGFGGLGVASGLLERAGLSAFLGRRRRRVDSLDRIDTLEDWQALHARPGHHTVARTETVKFVIDLAAGGRTWFLDTRRWEVHFDFVQRFLDPFVDYERFNLREYTREDRRFILGSLMHYLDGDHWTVELSGGDTLSAPRLAWMFEHVTARAAAVRDWRFRPVSPMQAQKVAHEEVQREGQREGQRRVHLPVLPSDAPNTSVTYQPVVLGVAYGYVRLVREAQSMSAVHPTDLVVSEWVPEHIPPVAGLVTSQMQAPLAHVAVLTRNRNTPNMGLRGASDLEAFTCLEGQLVKLTVASQDYTVEPADLGQAQAAWAGLRPTAAWQPDLDATVRGMRDVATLDDAAARSVGAKAAQMGQLSRIEGLCTPGGFTLPFSAYLDHMTQAGLMDQVDAMLTDPLWAQDTGLRARRLAALRAAIQQHPVQEDLLNEMCARLQAWAAHRQTILRSSTNAEDLEGFSGAGLYESIVVPANPSPGRVADALREVWASVWLQRAFEERDWYRIAHRAVAMGVLVQPMVEDAVATGVAITGNPFKPGQEAVFINTQWTGASVTGALGDQVPEQYLVATWTGVCEPELISRSSLAGGAPIFSEDELLALTAQLQRIHRSEMQRSAHAQADAPAKVHAEAHAMDVEFALTRQRRFVILQARPYTIVYSLDRAQPQRRKPGWSRQLAHRLHRLSHRLQQGWRELTGAAVRA